MWRSNGLPRRQPGRARRRAGLVVAAAVVMGVLLVAGLAGAQGRPAAGQLDVGFGMGGKVVSDFGQSDVPEAAAVQPDGKILVGGVVQDPVSGDTRFVAARYMPSGAPDTTFGSGGRVIFGFGGHESSALGMALQPDGKIILVGFESQRGYAYDLALLRFNTDGSLDRGFGSGGTVTTDLGSREAAKAVAVQPDGKIVAAGYTGLSGAHDFVVARYQPDGGLDAGFGSGGHTSTDFGADDRGTGVAVQPDGKIVAVGETYSTGASTTPYGVAVARYNADGSLDTSFAGDGRATVANGAAADALVQRDKILVAGWSMTTTGASLAVFRFDSAGSLDSGFGRGGVASASFGAGSGGWADAIAVQADGEIVAAGETCSGTCENSDFAVARFNPNGRLDPAFGTAGVVATDLRGGSYERATGLALGAGGKIIAAGPTAPAGASFAGDFALARYHGNVCVVPNVKRTTLAAARRAITKAQCGVGKISRAHSPNVSKGRVISQKPAARTRLRLGSPVALFVSRGKRIH